MCSDWSILPRQDTDSTKKCNFLPSNVLRGLMKTRDNNTAKCQEAPPPFSAPHIKTKKVFLGAWCFLQETDKIHSTVSNSNKKNDNMITLIQTNLLRH